MLDVDDDRIHVVVVGEEIPDELSDHARPDARSDEFGFADEVVDPGGRGLQTKARLQSQNQKARR